MRAYRFAFATLFLVAGSAWALTSNETVDATAGWVDTGIPVVMGDAIEINATGLGSPNGVDFYGPDGDGGDCVTCLVTIAGSRYALVGSVGAAPGSEFVVGSTFAGTAPATGNLFLAFNDDVFGDNAGSFDATVVVPVCGDGLIEGAEQCDDANLVNADGCSDMCMTEPGFSCVGEPSFCEATGPQSGQQQKCIAKMHKASWFVAKKQGKVINLCLRQASRGKLGKQSKQEAETITQCVANDDNEAISRRIEKIAEVDERWCLSSLEKIPQFGYAGAGAAASASGGAAEGLARDLFGDSMDAAFVLRKDNAPGADCQRVTHRFYQTHFDAIWRTASKGTKQVLDDSVQSADDLLAALLGYVDADAKGLILKSADRFAQKVADACATSEAAAELPTLFPGTCGADTSAVVVDCALQGARCRFCQSLRGTGAYPVDCDVYDEGAANLSCE